MEADVIAEAHLDPESILAGVTRFARSRAKRLAEQRSLLTALESGAAEGRTPRASVTGIPIGIPVLGLTLLGDGLRDVLDTRIKVVP